MLAPAPRHESFELERDGSLGPGSSQIEQTAFSKKYSLLLGQRHTIAMQPPGSIAGFDEPFCWPVHGFGSLPSRLATTLDRSARQAKEGPQNRCPAVRAVSFAIRTTVRLEEHRLTLAQTILPIRA
jgi:hypothetical protein